MRFSAINTPKPVFRRHSAPDPAGELIRRSSRTRTRLGRGTPPLHTVPRRRRAPRLLGPL